MLEQEKLEKTFKVEINGKFAEIKMTYGLLNELMKNVRDLNGVATFFTDPDIRNEALDALLAIRNEYGKVTEARHFDEILIEEEDIEALLSWAVTHVTGFFIRSLTNMTNQLAKLQTVGSVLQSSQDGTEDSPSNKQSDGPST